MGIEYEHTESSEVDPYANEWCHQAFASITGKGGLGHEFTSVDQQIHYRPASDRRLSMRSDMYVAGASCQPWSAMAVAAEVRQRMMTLMSPYSMSDTIGVHDHRLYPINPGSGYRWRAYSMGFIASK